MGNSVNIAFSLKDFSLKCTSFLRTMPASFIYIIKWQKCTSIRSQLLIFQYIHFNVMCMWKVSCLAICIHLTIRKKGHLNFFASISGFSFIWSFFSFLCHSKTFYSEHAMNTFFVNIVEKHNFHFVMLTRRRGKFVVNWRWLSANNDLFHFRLPFIFIFGFNFKLTFFKKL